MLRFGETKIRFQAAERSINVWDVNVDQLVISKLSKTKTNSKYLIEIKFDKSMGPLDLIMPKMNEYVKTFEVKNGDQDKNNKLMSLRRDYEKLFENYKAIWTKIEDLKKY